MIFSIKTCWGLLGCRLKPPMQNFDDLRSCYLRACATNDRTKTPLWLNEFSWNLIVVEFGHKKPMFAYN